MRLTLRPAGLSSPAYRDWLDYVIVEDGRDVERLYEHRHSRPELRWFWSITGYTSIPSRICITASCRSLLNGGSTRECSLKRHHGHVSRW
jgi:hypothetical protein